MTKDEELAMNLALEALEGMDILFSPLSRDCTQYNAVDKAQKAITAIKQTRALDKKAENARELGLDYEPAPVQEVSWGVDWGKAGDKSCAMIIKRLPDGKIEVVAVEYEP